VSTGVETSGKKDNSKITDFVEAVKREEDIDQSLGIRVVY